MTCASSLVPAEDRFFDPEPTVRSLARELFGVVAGYPILSPHGHLPARVLATNECLGDPAEALVLPDHYILRMLYSQGVPLEALGVTRRDGGPVETDHRKVFQRFGEHAHLFQGTPTGAWLDHTLHQVFGITQRLSGETAGAIYDSLDERLHDGAYRPRALYQRFGIEMLATTDDATDELAAHRTIRESGWPGRVIPTFRPDALFDIARPGWKERVADLSRVSGIEVSCYRAFVLALEGRRSFFKEMGAVATDHGAATPMTHELGPLERERLFERALRGKASERDSVVFSAHMLMEMAGMSVEDGLVMQLHAGSLRDHNRLLYERFGPDMGCDIPLQTEYTRNLRALLEKYGNEERLRLVVFTLDESVYSRELAPLAGHYPALRLGGAWWFHDSVEGMQRYLERVTETAGFYNTVGFTDDTRSLPSIQARHDMARRVEANFLARLVARNVLDLESARRLIRVVVDELPRQGYRL